MVKRQGRHTAAQNLSAASEALEGSKTISQYLNYQTQAEEHFELR